MKTDRIELSAEFPVSPGDLYSAWLDSSKHTAFTGGEAEASNKVGGSFTAWDGYISGKNIELEPGKRILQSWRTSEFSAEVPDSKLEITVKSKGSGCELTLKHWEIPAGDGEKYKQGWQEYYLSPMREYFS